MKSNFRFETLRSKLFVLITVILLLTTLTIIYFVNLETDKVMLATQENHAQNILTSVELNVDNEYKSIKFYETRLIKIKQEELKRLTNLAYSVIKSNYSRYKQGKISLKEAKQKSLTQIKNLRYDDGTGYFWINDTGRPIPKMIMHPTQSELDGKVLDDEKYNCIIDSNENLFKVFVEICQEKGEGFVNYLWPKPTEKGLTEQQPKISFVIEFKPWKWIVGTGIYVDDIKTEVDKRVNSVLQEIKETLSKIKLGKEGYLFIFKSDLTFLIHPELEKANEYSSTTGKEILKEIMNTAKSEKKTYDYTWVFPDEAQKSNNKKRAFIEYYDPLDWFIVSSFYYSEIESHTNELQRKIYFIAGFFLIVSFIFSLLLSKNITQPLKFLVDSAKSLETNSSAKFDAPSKGSVEIRELSGVLINLFSSIKKTSDDLRKSEDRLNKTLMATKDGIWDINLLTNETYFDPMYYKISGYTPYEFPPDVDEWKKRIHPEDIEYVMRLVRDHLKNKLEIYKAEYRFRAKNGEWLWMLGRGQVIERDEKGRALRFVGTQSNITARKLVEDKLQKSYEQNLKHQETVNNIAINSSLQSENFKEACKVITEIAAKELEVERCSIWLLGLNKRHLKCVNLFQLSKNLHSESPPLYAKDYPVYFSVLHSKKSINASDALSDPRTSEFRENYLIPQNIFSLLDASINLEGKMIGVLCFESVNEAREWLPDEITFATRIADQTSLAFLNSKRLEAKAELQKSEEELRIANDELQSILYVASHDLRSPLVNITGFSAEMNTIIDEIEDYLAGNFGIENDKVYSRMKNELAESKKLIHLNTAKMDSLLKGLLQLSRLGKAALNLKFLDVNDIVKKTVMGMNYQIEQSKAIVKVEPLPKCYSDETLTIQIFSNLIDNAIKYLDPQRPGNIRIYKSSSDKTSITYCVEDNGIGIKKEYHSKIFEIFHRLDPYSEIDGIGVGLTIIQKMLKKLNGSIYVESEPGIGSRFYVSFPLDELE